MKDIHIIAKHEQTKEERRIPFVDIVNNMDIEIPEDESNDCTWLRNNFFDLHFSIGI